VEDKTDVADPKTLIGPTEYPMIHTRRKSIET